MNNMFTNTGLASYLPTNYFYNSLGTSTASDLLNPKKLAGNGFVGINSAGNNGSGSGGFFADIGGLGGVAGILQGLSGLAGAYSAYKGLGLAKEQFAFEKGLANRNLANQAKIINTGYDNAAQVAAGMIGGQDAQGNYGFTDPAIVERYAQAAKDKYVDGSPIG